MMTIEQLIEKLADFDAQCLLVLDGTDLKIMQDEVEIGRLNLE